ncbi:hypothetical protein OpiT1DRAFT_04483 [Opitutaceae bacterium TAV1]|nr:hypothetical protein OpiT1DRAFT_04483 [Opitutaceae bacterium TAV1]
MNTSKPIFVSFGLSLASMLAMAVLPARAALTINLADITDGTYAYSLSYNKLYPGSSNDPASTPVSSGIIAQDAFELNNMAQSTDYQSGSNARFGYVRARDVATATTVSLTYKFDFSSLDHSVSEVSFYDYLRLDVPTGGCTNSAVTSYSLNGTDWTQLRSVSVSTGGTRVESRETTIIDFSGSGESALPTVVYYRAEFTTTIAGKMQWGAVQWARGDSRNPDEESFNATFTLAPLGSIPEVSTLAWVFGISLVGLAYAFRCRR